MKFVHHDKTIIAISSYAGKPVRGKAKCEPGDDYDIALGEKLAALRCNLKIAKKRSKNASKKFADAKKTLARAKTEVANMEDYLTNATMEEIRLVEEYKELMKKIG